MADSRTTPPGHDWITDPDMVAAEYSSEETYRQRWLAFRELLEGPDDVDIVRQRILEARPARLLDLGSGLGDLCAWARDELDAEVFAIDASPRMVELSGQAGATALQADIRSLPFADASFDSVTACSVLYHVPDPERAIAEAARVLVANGLFIATTGSDDEHERIRAWESLFGEEIPDYPPQSFSRENGRDLTLRSFRNADRVDCDGALVFRTRERLVRYVNALVEGKDAVVPELSEPFRLPFTASVFVANAPR